jgi:uncharacterized protein YeeX (DUF496 family)
MDRKDLKVQALLENISNLTTQYENKIADLRVELTETSQQLEEAYYRIQQLENESAEVPQTDEEVPAEVPD